MESSGSTSFGAAAAPGDELDQMVNLRLVRAHVFDRPVCTNV